MAKKDFFTFDDFSMLSIMMILFGLGDVSRIDGARIVVESMFGRKL